MVKRIVVVLVAVLLLGSVGAGVVAMTRGAERDPSEAVEGPRPLTAAEADRLGVTRFRNHTAGAREVALAIPHEGRTMLLRGAVDFRSHLGYGVLTGADPEGPVLVQWTMAAVVVRPWVADRELPARPPRDGWVGRRLAPAGATLDTALLLTLNLAGDRPENAQLLSQNGARWLRSERAGGKPVDVVSGPAPATGEARRSRTRFWLTADGTMVRFEADVETAEQPIVATLGEEHTGPVRRVPGLRDRAQR